MELLTEWIMQILVFMVLGTIVELLLPNNKMKKYVNLVLGLLLLLLLTKPILYVFSVDVTSLVNQMDNNLFHDQQTMILTETALEKQKSEIQATQDAYIWNEVTSQLKQEANDTLKEQHDTKIVELHLEIDPNNEIELIHCIITPINKSDDDNRTIHPIEVEINRSKDGKERPKERQAITTSLAEIWGVKTSQIHLQWEGGTN